MFGQKPAGAVFGGFGQQNQQQAQQQPSTSPFGQPNTGTGLFGTNNNATMTATQPSTNLFGSTPAQNTQQQQQQQQPTTNIFGQPAAGSTSLFGSTNQPAQQNAPATNLFSSTATQAQPQQTTSLFGTSAAAPQNSGLFGGGTTSQQQQPQPMQAFGGFGGVPAPSQQMQQSTTCVPYLIIMWPNFSCDHPHAFSSRDGRPGYTSPLFTRNTKFNDLPEDVRKKFEQMESVILFLHDGV